MRKGYQPRHIKLYWKGRAQPVNNRAEIFAEQLAEQQWANNMTPEQKHYLENLPPIFPINTDIKTTEFTKDEIDEVLNQLKKHRAPGPDEITNEEILLLDDIHQTELLAIMNECWRTQKIPEEWKYAHVVNIFKGSGPSQDPTRYRPISLLNVQYKIYARLIQTRIASKMDSQISDTQFGFRKGRSTGDPIHILRRFQEMFEATKEPLYMMFLDWSMAFDKLSHRSHIILKKIRSPPPPVSYSYCRHLHKSDIYSFGIQ